MDVDAEKILKDMNSRGGGYPLQDKADAKTIKRETGLSRNAFKRAVGRLLKAGKMRLHRMVSGQNKAQADTEESENGMAFAHLHVHTEYSLLDGSSKIKGCCTARAKELGMDSVADHGPRRDVWRD